MEPRLQLHKLTKEYQDQRVLRKVSGSFDNQVVALLGPNGAGKSTLLKMLSTQMRPSSGHFTLDQQHSLTEREAIRNKIGMIGHHSFLYRMLHVRENLRFYGQMYNVSDVEEKIAALAKQFDIEDRLDMPLGQLSRGLLQRVSLARALLHEPSLLLFDEPFTGLDTHSAEQLIELLVSWQETPRLIFLTTHDLHHAAHCCQRFLFLSRGKLAKDVPHSMDITELREAYREFCR